MVLLQQINFHFLIGISFFFILAWAGQVDGLYFYQGEISHHHIIWPLALGYFFHNLTKEDKKLFYKKTKKK